MWAALASALLGCFTPQPLPYPTQRVRLGYFSFLPPNEPDWLRAPADQWSFAAARRGAHQDESYALHAEIQQAPPIASDEEFLAQGRETFALGPPPEADSRFEMKSSDVEPWPRLGARCLRVVLVSVDHDPVRSSGSHHAMILSAVTFYCVNPHEARAGIMIAMSHRCDEGNEDPELIQKAEAFAATLEFLSEP